MKHWHLVCLPLSDVDAWCSPSLDPLWDELSLLDDRGLGLVSEKQLVAAFEVAQRITCSNSAVLEENVADWDGDRIRSKPEGRHFDVGRSPRVVRSGTLMRGKERFFPRHVGDQGLRQ